ncbi:MAG TPA: cysteine dioxygenase family protein [Pseudonocardiaceae bacterium]|jgi:predicted metal-dependent enzyme (double-stranded beta helix superfamily)|nr:cysteine dioxygenase family protein [Pseudonocardiaceae bacterium]
MFAVPPNTIALPASPAAAHPVRVATEVARDRARWAHLLRYDPQERFSALVEATEDFEIWLLSWLPGQYTDTHDHDGSAGAFTVINGELTERVVKPADGDRAASEVVHTVSAGQSRAFGPRYVHQVRNDGIDPAVTIHVYRPHRAIRIVG